MTSHALRVLVVDDHDLFRSGICALLEEEGFEVSGCARGEQAAPALERFPADVVLMDLNMPGISGIEATSRVVAASPGISVLMLTINRDDDQVLDALRAGASGYLLKDAELDDIVGAIRAAAAGQSVLAPAAAGVVLAQLRKGAATEPASDPVAGLTPREREILVLLARGCDNASIGQRLFLAPSTVKHHVSRLLDKLGVDNRLQAAAYAFRRGLGGDGGSSG
jgi:DNA-binding NarL/FixJ family response regulator